MSNTNYKTEQEEFWASDFGDDYINRNNSEQLFASNISFFSSALKQTRGLESMIEFGANIGMNLKAIKALYPTVSLRGIEINQKAAEELKKLIGEESVQNCSIFDVSTEKKSTLSLIKGVLIHINPDMLDAVYQKLYDNSSRYILIAEYYNHSPVAINYRGHTDRLFKRDFAGEVLKKFDDLELIDYGFVYKGDPNFPQDDITWFLIEKK